jgi:hypothetical protein
VFDEHDRDAFTGDLTYKPIDFLGLDGIATGRRLSRRRIRGSAASARAISRRCAP